MGVNTAFRRNKSLHVYAVGSLFFVLMALGFTNLYSAGIGSDYFSLQMRNLLVVMPAFFIVGWVIPIRMIADYANWLLGIVVLMLVVVLITGRYAGGSQRWLSLGPIGGQPSELAKLVVAISVARFFSMNKLHHAYRIRDLLPILAIVGMVFALIFMQPDFGTAGVCLIIAMGQLLFIKVDWRSVALVLISSPMVAAIGWHTLLRPYQKLRILNLLNPDLDPTNTGYNSLQSLVAIGSGHLFGKGFMMGTQTQLKFLPARHTDFVFSVFAEEHGFWGGVLVFSLFVGLTFLGLDIARRSKDTFCCLLAVGISALIFSQFAINVAMVLGLFPVVGLPLPFFSYGSSSLLTVSLGLGLLLSIQRYTESRKHHG